MYASDYSDFLKYILIPQLTVTDKAKDHVVSI